MATPQIKKRIIHGIEFVFVFIIALVFGVIMYTYAFGSTITTPWLLGGANSLLSKKIVQPNKVKQIRERYIQYQHEHGARLSHAYLASASSTESVQENDSAHAVAVPILMYHAVLPTQDGEDHSIAEFEDHMFALKAAGYQTITIQQYVDFMNGEIELPTKSVLLTFDDGRTQTFYPVDPYLEALDFTAAFYVITGHLLSGEENSYYLAEQELHTVLATGRWEIESHGRFDHDPIIVSPSGEQGYFVPNPRWLTFEQRYETPQEHENRVYTDLREAKNDIQELFGHMPISYAVPRGDFGSASATKQMVLRVMKDIYPVNFFQVRPDIETGYYTQNYAGLDDMSLSRRIKAPLNVTGEELVDIIEGGTPKSLPYSDPMKSPFQWVQDSMLDTSIISSGTIHLAPRPGKTVGHLYLDGTRHWNNYTFSANAVLHKGKTYKLLARAVTGNDYASCVYYLDRVRLQQMHDGVEEVVAENRLVALNPYVNHTSAIRVQGDEVSCLFNGAVVLQRRLAEGLPTYGGVGVKTWDPLPDNSYVTIHAIDVEPM